MKAESFRVYQLFVIRSSLYGGGGCILCVCLGKITCSCRAGVVRVLIRKGLVIIITMRIWFCSLV